MMAMSVPRLPTSPATVKILFNSVISTPGAHFTIGDHKDFYLNTLMTEYEYMHIPVSVIPDSIIQEYKLADLVHHNHVYVGIQKGMGLPQAGHIANDHLTAFLTPHGYAPVPVTPGLLWKHAHSDLDFSLMVNDFGVKYKNKSDAEQLMQMLKELYSVSED
jgi:hypothetical protein